MNARIKLSGGPLQCASDNLDKDIAEHIRQCEARLCAVSPSTLIHLLLFVYLSTFSRPSLGVVNRCGVTTVPPLPRLPHDLSPVSRTSLHGKGGQRGGAGRSRVPMRRRVPPPILPSLPPTAPPTRGFTTQQTSNCGGTATTTMMLLLVAVVVLLLIGS